MILQRCCVLSDTFNYLSIYFLSYVLYLYKEYLTKFYYKRKISICLKISALFLNDLSAKVIFKIQSFKFNTLREEVESLVTAII